MFLNAQNISFGYASDKNVVSNISLSLAKGETLAIVGASGCGKSTLLRIISGILPNSPKNKLSGNISVEGLDPNQYRKTGRLSFMFQDSTLLPNLTVKENIELPLKIRKEKNGHKSQDLLKAVGLDEFGSYLPKQLSGGMKTRVSLARSFITHPELLLLDEPFSALDIAWKSKLYMELEKLREQCATSVIIVTHDVQEALLLADQVVVMNKNGEIEAALTIDTDYSIKDRVRDISKYMNSVYEGYMLPIQDAIINGQSKKNEKQDHILIA